MRASIVYNQLGAIPLSLALGHCKWPQIVNDPKITECPNPASVSGGPPTILPLNPQTPKCQFYGAPENIVAVDTYIPSSMRLLDEWIWLQQRMAANVASLLGAIF